MCRRFESAPRHHLPPLNPLHLCARLSASLAEGRVRLGQCEFDGYHDDADLLDLATVSPARVCASRVRGTFHSIQMRGSQQIQIRPCGSNSYHLTKVHDCILVPDQSKTQAFFEHPVCRRPSEILIDRTYCRY